MSKEYLNVPLECLLTKSENWIEIKPDEQYQQVTVKLWGKGVILRDIVNGVDIGASKRLLVRSKQFILSKIDARNGAIGLVPEALDGAIVSQDFPVFTVNHQKILPEFLEWMSKTNSFVNLCKAASEGTTNRVRLQEKIFLATEISLPPLEEQRRIVARIEELAAKIEEARGLRKAAVEEAEALISSLFRQKLAGSQTQGRLEEILLSKPRNGWSAPCDNAETGVPVLTLSAVTGFRYKETAFKRTSESTNPNAHYWLNNGDLLITRSNTPELVGHAAIYNGSPRPCIYPDLMMKLEINDQLADREFVLYWLRSTTVRDYIYRMAKGTSPSMKKINQATVTDIPFPTHLTLPEQREIVTYFNDLQAKVDALKQLQAETSAELDAMLPSVLDKAFKGEL